MYVCLCNGLTDSQIEAAVAAGADRPKAVYAACGGHAQCGGCTRSILAAIREAAPPPPASPGGGGGRFLAGWFAQLCPPRA